MIILKDPVVLLHGKPNHLKFVGGCKSCQKADNLVTSGFVRGRLCSSHRRPTATDGIGRRNLSIVGRNCGRKNCRILLNLKPSARLSDIHQQGQRSSLCIHNGWGGFYCWSDKILNAKPTYFKTTAAQHFQHCVLRTFEQVVGEKVWGSGRLDDKK